MKGNKNEELQSRRQFFKKAAKSALPILGAIALVNMPLLVKAEHPTSCRYGCASTCDGTCIGTCIGTCKRTCEGNCKYTCTGTCHGSCGISCTGGCY